MARGLAEIAWHGVTEAAPAMVTALSMPFTFSIAGATAFGFIRYAVIKLAAGRWHEVHPAVRVLAALFIVNFALIG